MTDHYTEATRLIDGLHNLEGHNADFDMALAQTHAVLALAEQQRVSNLIALAKLSWEPLDDGGYGEGAALANDALHALIQYEHIPATQTSSEDDFPIMNYEIARALRIETP